VKVLIVEDNEASRRLLALNFTQAGYDVVVAGDGAEGLAKVIEQKPHFVVTDLEMPGMHGREMIREIRRRPEGRSMKVIVLTGQDVTVGEGAREAGADAVLYKPLSFDSLNKVVRELFGQAAAL
jgi:DNA-binding response OmpR family regulator